MGGRGISGIPFEEKKNLGSISSWSNHVIQRVMYPTLLFTGMSVCDFLDNYHSNEEFINGIVKTLKCCITKRPAN